MIDDIFAGYLQCCYRVIDNDISQAPTREVIRSYLPTIMPNKVFHNESLAHWHYDYVRHACKEAAKAIASADKKDARNVKNLMKGLHGKEVISANDPRFNVRELGSIADMLNKEWLKRLFFVPSADQVNSRYRLDGSNDGIFAAAVVMTMAKRAGVWPVIDDIDTPRQWALQILRRVA